MTTKILSLTKARLIRVAAMFVTTLSIIIIFTISLSRFKNSDVVPTVLPITDEKKVEIGPFSAEVTTGLFIKNFTLFDVQEDKFILDAIVWFEFAPNQISLDMLEQFSFANGEVIKLKGPDISRLDKRVLARYDVIVQFSCDPRYHYFPFDAHTIPIILSNNSLMP